MLAVADPPPSASVDLGPIDALRSVFLMLGHRISDGETADIRQTLPAELRGLRPRH